MPPTEKLDVVGLRDIAKLLKVDARTPKTWRDRKILPPEDGTVSGNVPIWRRSTILAWARQTNRLPDVTGNRQPVTAGS